MMDQDQLQRLMRLARKTNNPLIMTDPEGLAPMVLMDVDHYERLVDNGERSVDPQQEALPILVDEPWEVEPVQDEVGELAVYSEETNAQQDAKEDAWSLDELPEEFFAEPPLQSMGPTPSEEAFVTSDDPEVAEVPLAEPTIEPIEQPEAQENQEESDDEDPGEEQFYLEAIE